LYVEFYIAGKAAKATKQIAASIKSKVAKRKKMLQ
jgi:hypothetical protein